MISRGSRHLKDILSPNNRLSFIIGTVRLVGVNLLRREAFDWNFSAVTLKSSTVTTLNPFLIVCPDDLLLFVLFFFLPLYTWLNTLRSSRGERKAIGR